MPELRRCETCGLVYGETYLKQLLRPVQVQNFLLQMRSPSDGVVQLPARNRGVHKACASGEMLHALWFRSLLYWRSSTHAQTVHAGQHQCS